MKRFLLPILLLSVMTGYGQLSDWLISFDNSHSTKDIVVDDSGYVYVVGGILNPQWATKMTDTLQVRSVKYSSPHIPERYRKAYVAKLDSGGNMIWCRMIGGNQSIRQWSINANHIAIDGQGDLVISTQYYDTLMFENDTIVYRSAPGANRVNSSLIKLTRNGNFKWLINIPNDVMGQEKQSKSKILIGQNDEIYYNPANDSGGGAWGVNELLYHYDQSGNSLGTFPITNGTDFTVDGNKNVIMGFNGSFFGDTLLVFYDSNGVKTSSVLSTEGNPRLFRLERDASGNLYGYGYSAKSKVTIDNFTLTNGSGGPLSFLIKFNSTGTALWMYRIACESMTPDWYSDLKIYGDEVLVTGGFFTSFCYRNFSYPSKYIMYKVDQFIMKIDENGVMKWAKFVENVNAPYGAGSIAFSNDERIYVSGYALDNWGKDTVGVDAYGATYGRGFLYKIRDGSNLLSGKVYIDSNANNIPDNADTFMPWQVIELNGTPKFLTDRNGEYSIFVPPGNYTVDHTSLVQYHNSTPNTHSIVFTGVQQKDTNNHFKLVPVPNITDAFIDLATKRSRIRTSLNEKPVIFLDYKNKGTLALNDSLEFTFNSGKLSLDSASPPADFSSGNVMKWAYNLGLYKSDKIYLRFNNTGAIAGDILKYYCRIDPYAIDTFKRDNLDSASQRVFRSYDPNDKRVQPEGPVKPKYVQDENYFEYTIRFQNTGNDTAFSVRIRDTLSVKLRLETFEMIGASHDYRVELVDVNVLDFIFDPIVLPDSGSNQELSNGYVKFRIKADPTLDHGDFIENEAYIYFDLNDPILTNTVRTDIISWASLDEFEKAEEGFWVYPNPATSDFTIVLNEISDDIEIQLMDLTGRTVYFQDQFDSRGNEVRIGDLNLRQGLYVISVKQDGQVFTKKMIFY